MALLWPDVGEVKGLTDFLSNGENWTLKLFSNNITPAETDVAATYTEATFTGYTSKTLTRTVAGGTWGTPTTSSGITSSTYGTAQTWSPTTSQTIYGYYVVGATSTTLLFTEAFASAKNLVNGDSLTVTPKMQFD